MAKGVKATAKQAAAGRHNLIKAQVSRIGLRGRRRLKRIKRKFIETLFVVENKQRQLVPFIYNPIQDDADKSSTGMDIWVKPAQVGFSTERIANRLADTLTVPGTNTVLIAYEDFITQRLLGKVSFFYNYLSNMTIPRVPELYNDAQIIKKYS